jgi:hypothetical protein
MTQAGELQLAQSALRFLRDALEQSASKARPEAGCAGDTPAYRPAGQAPAGPGDPVGLAAAA